MSLSKTPYPLLSTGSAQEDRLDMTEKIVDWDLKNKKHMFRLGNK